MLRMIKRKKRRHHLQDSRGEAESRHTEVMVRKSKKVKPVKLPKSFSLSIVGHVPTATTVTLRTQCPNTTVTVDALMNLLILQ